MVIIRKNPKNRTGWLVVVTFSICLHERDMRILENIQAYFGGAGSIKKTEIILLNLESNLWN
jgi:hypothetical protein